MNGLTGASGLAAGYGHACALLSNGTMRCWGENRQGQLGNGATANPGTAQPVTVTGISGVTAFTTGAYHTCAVLGGGTVRCWGRNDNAQLGNGTYTSSSTPVAVTGLTGVTAISGGGTHTCAVLSDATVRCWGENEFGQLGTGTTASSTTPAAVVGLSGVVDISVGWRHTCALLGQWDHPVLGAGPVRATREWQHHEPHDACAGERDHRCDRRLRPGGGSTAARSSTAVR